MSIQPIEPPSRGAAVIPEFTLGDRLRKARELSGMDMQQLAEVIDVHRQSIARYESGVVVPKRHVLLSWSWATGVDADWVLGTPATSTIVEQVAGTTDLEFKVFPGVNSRVIPLISFDSFS